MYIMYQNSVSTALRMQTALGSKTTQVTLFENLTNLVNIPMFSTVLIERLNKSYRLPFIYF